VPPPKPAELDAWIAAHEQQIADYYKAHQTSYFQDTRAHVRQIFVRAPKDDGDAKRAEAKTKAEGLLKEVQGGKSFADVAKASERRRRDQGPRAETWGSSSASGLPGPFGPMRSSG